MVLVDRYFPVEILLVIVPLALLVWSIAVAARRGLWGWCIAIFLFPALGMILFWVINPPSKNRPNAAV